MSGQQQQQQQSALERDQGQTGQRHKDGTRIGLASPHRPLPGAASPSQTEHQARDSPAPASAPDPAQLSPTQPTHVARGSRHPTVVRLPGRGQGAIDPAEEAPPVTLPPTLNGAKTVGAASDGRGTSVGGTPGAGARASQGDKPEEGAAVREAGPEWRADRGRALEVAHGLRRRGGRDGGPEADPRRQGRDGRGRAAEAETMAARAPPEGVHLLLRLAQEYRPHGMNEDRAQVSGEGQARRGSRRC